MLKSSSSFAIARAILGCALLILLAVIFIEANLDLMLSWSRGIQIAFFIFVVTVVVGGTTYFLALSKLARLYIEVDPNQIAILTWINGVRDLIRSGRNEIQAGVEIPKIRIENLDNQELSLKRVECETRDHHTVYLDLGANWRLDNEAALVSVAAFEKTRSHMYTTVVRLARDICAKKTLDEIQLNSQSIANEIVLQLSRPIIYPSTFGATVREISSKLVSEYQDQLESTSKQNEVSVREKVVLLDVLHQNFSLDEIKDVCFRIGLDPEFVPHDTIPQLSLGLIQWSARRGKTIMLGSHVVSMRPHVASKF